MREDWEATSAAKASHPHFASEAAKYLSSPNSSPHTAGAHALETVDGKLLPWFQPIAAHAHSRWASKQSSSARLSAISLAEGRWWAPLRLYEQGVAESPFCELCGEVGDLPHRMARCPRRQEYRDAECPTWLVEAANKRPKDPLFAAGLPARPSVPCAPPWLEYDVGTPPTDGALATGNVYTDGALRGLVPCTRRAGWAYIVINGDERTWGRYGTMGELFCTIFRAELKAVVEVLRCACPPLTIHTDNQQVVDGWLAGKIWSCASNRDGADLWRQFWALMADIGGGVHITKVKAHVSFAKVQAGAMSRLDWCGNGLADLWAKAACALALKESPVAEYHSAWLAAIAWYRWATRFATEWGPTDTTKSASTEARTPRAPPPST